MKRLLSILSTIGLTATTCSAVVSCTSTNKGSTDDNEVTNHTAVFSVASLYHFNQENQTSKKVKAGWQYYEIDISGIGFNFIPDFNPKNFDITPSDNNTYKTKPVIEYGETTIASSNTKITIKLSSNTPIIIPAGNTDSYLITYIDNKNDINLSITLLVHTVKDD